MDGVAQTKLVGPEESSNRVMSAPSSPLSSVVQNTGILLTGEILAQAIAFPVGILIARILGVQSYSQYAVALALTSGAAGLFLMGLDAIVVRETARTHGLAGRILFGTLLPAAAWSILVGAFLQLLALLLGYSQQVRLLLWFVAFQAALTALLNLVRASFRGLEKMREDAFLRILESALALVLAAPAVFLQDSIVLVAVALLVARAIAFLIALPLARRAVGGGLAVDSSLMPALVRASVPIGVFGVITGLYYRIDAVLLGAWRSEQEVGLYTVAFGFYMLWLVVSISAARAIAPRLSRLFADGALDAFQALFVDGLRYTLAIALPIGLMTMLLSRQFIAILYGPEYAAASPALAVLGASLVVLFVNTYLLNVLVAAGKQTLLAPIAVVGLFAMLVLSIVLIPSLGIIGAALSAVLRECVLLVLYLYFVSKTTGSMTRLMSALKPTFAAVVLAGFLLLFGEALKLLLLIPLGGILYALVLCGTGGIRADEIGLSRATMPAYLLKLCFFTASRSRQVDSDDES